MAHQDKHKQDKHKQSRRLFTEQSGAANSACIDFNMHALQLHESKAMLSVSCSF